jgi:ATP-dependent exoDNAse (exonuclease V) alpha subunit
LHQHEISYARCGGVGALSLNIELQAALNPIAERRVERFGWTFAPGDKVMQVENDYDKESTGSFRDQGRRRKIGSVPLLLCVPMALFFYDD